REHPGRVVGSIATGSGLRLFLNKFDVAPCLGSHHSIRPQGAPFPKASPETGYYGIPLLKPPQWKPEVPLYFFVGGAAGAAAVIDAIGHYTGADAKLVRDARWIAAAGAVISPALLIADLGRPERFLAMMRVF